MKTKPALKKPWDKLWFLIWKDDSFKGWVFSILFIFIFIKFIFFPTLGFLTGTSLPLAIVESCSMYHDGNLFSNSDSWWERHEEKYSEFRINDLDFKEFIFQDGFNKGDILLIVKAKPEKLEEGDVIIFDSNQRNPIIHRIINTEEKDGERIFSTIGDNNNGQLNFEKSITQDKLVGKAVFKVAPYFGWVKLIFYEWQKPTSERGFCDEN
jgi:signal peptidase I